MGDGDTSSFSEVVTSQPYKEHGDIIPVKLECVGHVQKRLGTRLRNLVKQHKGTIKAWIHYKYFYKYRIYKKFISNVSFL